MHGMVFTPGSVAAFVELRHCDLASRTPLFGYANPADVGPMAVRLMRIVRGEAPTEESARFRADAAIAGNLIYAVERYGCTFDDIIDIAGLGVANLLAQITPDCRLSGPRRSDDLRSQIGQATPEAQTLRLAEILCAAEALESRFRNDSDAVLEHDLALKAWLAQRLSWLGAMHKLMAFAPIKKRILACQETLLRMEAARESVRDAIKLRDAAEAAEAAALAGTLYPPVAEFTMSEATDAAGVGQLMEAGAV